MFSLNRQKKRILERLSIIEKDKIYDNYFEILDIKIKSKDHCLIDYGVVKDVLKFRDKIMNVLNCDYEKIKKDKKIKIYGGHELISWLLFNNELNIHMTYYAKGPKEEVNLFARAHEETHSLHAMKELNLLEKKLIEIRTPIKLNENIKDIYQCDDFEKELIANIGGFYALQKNNLNREKRMDMSVYSISGIFSSIIYELAIEYPELADLFFKRIIEENRIIKNEFELYKKFESVLI